MRPFRRGKEAVDAHAADRDLLELDDLRPGIASTATGGGMVSSNDRDSGLFKPVEEVREMTDQVDHQDPSQGGVDQPPAQNDPRYLYFLFVSLVFMLLIVPLLESGTFGEDAMHGGLTAVLITAAIASRRRRSVFIVTLFIVAIAAPLSWSSRYFHEPKLSIVSYGIEAVFFVVMAALILVAVVRRYMNSFHSIFGAICSYLLLGLAWSMLYMALLEYNPDTFAGFSGESVVTSSTQPLASKMTPGKSEVNAELSEMIYYSFVTMSTLGYGDITPQTGVARTFSWMQSVTGQFYIAVLVAWMVSEIPRRRREDGLD